MVILIATATANLVTTNMLSTRGMEVNQTEIKVLSIEKENQSLQVKIEEESKLGDLEKIASERGYVRTSNIVFVPTPATVALR